LNKKENKKKSSSLKLKTSNRIVELIYNKGIKRKYRLIIILPVLLTLLAGIYFVYSAYKTNGFFGFPLDDPWIHLTFARNLVKYGSYSYYKNELVTSGSTSPLYTLLMSLFFLISKNEFIISYTAGIGFGAFLVYILAKLAAVSEGSSGKLFEASFLALLTTMLIALQPRLNLINVSGMETSMFIFLVVSSFYAYHKRKMILLGILLGLTLWCRPDGFILWIAIAFDYLLQKIYFRKNPEDSGNSSAGQYISLKEISKAFSVAIIFAAGYFLFNFLLSGRIMPNTYEAKLAFYKNNSRSYFLKNGVLDYFTSSEFVLIWLPFLIGIFSIMKSFFKREKNILLVYLIFICGFILVYYIELPFAHRFGRYLMPVIPFYILIAVHGTKVVINFISQKISGNKNLIPNLVFILYVISAIGMFTYYNFGLIKNYAIICKYDNDRHVAVGNWLKANTPESAVVATHDIGAIAFYSERKIIDMAGLVTPQLIKHINDNLYSEYLNKYLAEHKVDYLVTLKNWFEVVNDKPVYVPINQWEFMDVYKYKPYRTHIQPRKVTDLNQEAIQMAQKGELEQAFDNLNNSLNLDTLSSQTYLLIGAVDEMTNDYTEAESFLNKAISIYPDYAEAYFGLAKVKFDQSKYNDCSNYLNHSLDLDPTYAPAIELRNQLDAKLIK
jgi:tetratricopeptide (TPR) repeat protein